MKFCQLTIGRGDEIAKRKNEEELAEVERLPRIGTTIRLRCLTSGGAGDALSPILESLMRGNRTPSTLNALARAYVGAGQQQLALYSH